MPLVKQRSGQERKTMKSIGVGRFRILGGGGGGGEGGQGLAHTNFFAQFQSAMFSQFRSQLSPLAKSVGRGRRDAQLNFH